jgi:glycine cleavage system H protein
MTSIPNDLQYTETHEWVRRLPTGEIDIGITDHAQHALGDLVFVELPAVGRTLKHGEPFAVVESVKAASDVLSPLGGTVVASNTALASRPELLNQEPYGAGWLTRIRPGADAVGTLLSPSAYAELLAREAS